MSTKWNLIWGKKNGNELRNLSFTLKIYSMFVLHSTFIASFMKCTSEVLCVKELRATTTTPVLTHPEVHSSSTINPAKVARFKSITCFQKISESVKKHWRGKIVNISPLSETRKEELDDVLTCIPIKDTSPSNIMHHIHRAGFLLPVICNLATSKHNVSNSALDTSFDILGE